MRTKFLILFLFCGKILLAGWFAQNSGTTKHLYGMNFNHGNENHVWACGEDGIILYSSNGGNTWVQQNSGTTNTLYAIVFIEMQGAPVFAVGENGTILRSTQETLVWTTIPSPTTKTLRDISEFGFIAVGDSGTMIRSTDAGLTWVLLVQVTTNNLNAVTGTFSKVAVGDGGTVLRAIDPGQTWQAMSIGTTENLYGVPLFFSPFLIVGANGFIAKSSNIGANWSMLPWGGNTKLNGIEYSVNNDSRIYITGNNGTILKSTNGGANFGRQISGTNVNLNATFFYLDDNTGYVVGNNGTILKTTDGGGVMTGIENNNSHENNFVLHQNYPNPFNPSTTIKFEIPAESFVGVKIYDAQGKEIEELVNEKLTAGSHSISFNGENLSSGIYYYKLISEKFSQVKKMILLK
jgi:photosystem II stability/assembly factor-like uncharacterized protein